MAQMDYVKIGLKAGIEIHQQLDTRKLFCDCHSKILNSEPQFSVIRKMRVAASEMGEYDQAALHETKKEMVFEYLFEPDTACLVELDEEPPHPLNSEALKISLQLSLLLKAKLVNEVHIMRKTVIDGSNTSGFQRTCLVSTDGVVETPEGPVLIPAICLEEDSARIISKEEGKNTFNLDRLGIPLIELATAPQMKTPNQVREAAYKIGSFLRSLKVRRGLGTIRQDVNISTRDGARVEIKGVQELDSIPLLVELEAQRQIALVEISKELKKKKAKVGELKDVSDTLKKSESKVIKGALEKGGIVMGVPLPGFAGLLGKEVQPNRRLGTELADYAKPYLAGIFHSDELPGYGITDSEVAGIKKELGESFAIAAGPVSKVRNGLLEASRRAELAIEGVPEETRQAKDDGTTTYLRPLPGASRMYPETDVPPVQVTDHMLTDIKASLPEVIDKKLVRFQSQYKLPKQMAMEVIGEGYSILFEKVVGELKLQPTVVANTLVSELPALRREGFNVDSLPDEDLFSVFDVLAKGIISKEGVKTVLSALASGKTLEQVLPSLGGGMTREELSKVVSKVLKEKSGFVKSQGSRAFQPLMGLVMKEVRGRIDGKLIAEELKKQLG
ncbi:MAG: Glu-tRNA(Gln) amidotransferase subunit GatE [archaeon]